MDQLQFNMLSLGVTAFVSIVVAFVPAAMKAPSRSKLLRDIEIYEKMRGLTLTPDEESSLALLRVSIGMRLDDLSFPSKRYKAISWILTALLIIVVLYLMFVPHWPSFGNAIIDFIIRPALALPAGLLCGWLSSHIAYLIAKRNIDAKSSYVMKSLREIDDGIAEGSEEQRHDDERRREQADERKDVVKKIHG